MKKNKKIITVSAPGKLMLFGEHAVVYNKPCIVTAVDQRMKVTIELLDKSEFHLTAKDVKISSYKKLMKDIGKGDIPKGAKFVELAVANFVKKYPLRYGLKITTKSEFSSLFGFGSSSAATVCVIKALSELTKKNLSEKAIFALSYKTVLDIQGKGSGFDVAAAVYGGTIYFLTGGKIIKPLKIKTLPLLVGYSGVKADTVTLINQVKEKADAFPIIIKNIYNNIEAIVESAKKAIEKHDWQTTGELMNFNQGHLAAFGVSTNKLADMIYAARSAGGYGAKLSGAGGGDCIISLAPKSKSAAVKKAIKTAGGHVITVTANAEGVKVEKN